jgi:hypothetical protein
MPPNMPHALLMLSNNISTSPDQMAHPVRCEMRYETKREGGGFVVVTNRSMKVMMK